MSSLYQCFGRALLAGSVNLVSDRLRMALLSGYTFDAEHKSVSEILKHEISTQGYWKGGQDFTVKLGKGMKVYASPVVWPVSIKEASGALVYIGESLPCLYCPLSTEEHSFAVAFHGNAFMEIVA